MGTIPTLTALRRPVCATTVLLVALLTSGCLKLSVSPPPIHEYRIDYPPPPPAAAPLPVVLRVTTFRAATVYDRDAIAYREREHRVGTYPYDRWIANPGRMIADLLARYLAASGLYRPVPQG